MRETHIIDASGKAVGRVASEAAQVLLGKTVTFKRNAVAEVEVKVTNASKMKIHPRKMDVKRYKTYSGYPGGLKERSAKQLIEKKGIRAVLLHAVKGMLPKNKLQDRRLRNLTVVE